MKYGLDFGTTNSAIAIADKGVGKVLPIDTGALDPGVIRTMLYFYPRKFIHIDNMPLTRIKTNTFFPNEYHYEGEMKSLIGNQAVKQYLEDNRHRTPGLIRTFLTGRFLSVGSASEDQASGNLVAERYEEIDYGTGRLVQGLKTGLKSAHFKGTTVYGKFMSLEELIFEFVSNIKKKADKEVGEDVEKVLVGRPVYFSYNTQTDHYAQNRLEEALKLVGFKSIEFEYEPVAAAKQFLALSKGKAQTILVFDFGGGTLDTAVVKVDRLSEKSKVLAADGVYIGGDLLNADIMQAKLWDYFGYNSLWSDNRLNVPRFIYEKLGSWISLPNLNNPETMQLFERIKYKNSNPDSIERFVYLIKSNVGFQLYEAIEVAKKELSFCDKARILYKDGPLDINTEITRSEFEEIIKPRVEEIKEVVVRTLRTANIEPEQVDIVVRTGGSSLIPIFEEMLVSIFDKEKLKQFETFTSIASGLALEK